MSDAPEHPPRSRSSRDPRIDFWRGLCVLGMAVWHLLSARLFDRPAFPAWLSFPVIQGFNFVAEGFVLLAGLAVGLAASRAADAPLRIAHYVRRAAQILLLHYATVALLLAVFEVPYQPEAFAGASLGQKTTAVLALWFQPYLGDILSVFYFLFLATPVLLAMRRAWGDGGLLAVSACVYAATVALAYAAPAWHRALDINRGGAFDFNTWQLVYVAGILLGVRYPACAARAQQRFGRWLAIGLVALAFATAAQLALKSWAGLSDQAKDVLLGRHPLGPVRAAYIGLQMLLIGLVTVRLWDRLAGRWPVEAVVTLGRHSLAVFTASVFLDYALKAAIGRWAMAFPANLTTLVIELGLLYLLARWLDRPGRPLTAA